jgi:YVTN family beta-propeller protein
MMENRRLAFVLSLISVLIVTGCRKLTKPESDVNYPAAYVINGEGNSISIIQLATSAVVETADFKKGSWPHHIYCNASKDKLVISLTGMDLSGGHAGHGGGENSYLLVVNPADLKTEAFLKTEEMAHNAIFMNNDEEIWLPQMRDDGIIRILDAKSLKEISTIAVGASPLELTKNSANTYAFVANGADHTVSVIDIASKTVIKTISVGMEPVGAWPGSNNKMYVDCELSKAVFEIDGATLEITDTISLSYTPAYVSYNAVTAELWVSDAEAGGVHTYELVSGQWVENNYLATGANTHAIAFNSAFDKAYVTNQGAANVSVIAVNTFTKIMDIPVGQKPNGIVIIE